MNKVLKFYDYDKVLAAYEDRLLHMPAIPTTAESSCNLSSTKRLSPRCLPTHRTLLRMGYRLRIY